MTIMHSRPRHKLGLTVAAVAGMLICAACGGGSGGTAGQDTGASSSASGSSGSTSPPTQMTDVTISYSQQVGDEIPLWIAKEAGYFEENGLNVSLKYLKSNAGIPALISGQVQMAAIGGSDALSAAAQGAELKYVETFAPVYTYQFWARPEYASAAKLKGKRVGITSTGGSLYAGTVVCLDKLGLTPSDVQIVPLGSVPAVDAALLSGSIAAAASHPPGTYKYKQQKFVKLVDLAKQKIPNANTGFAVTSSYAEENPDVVQAAVKSVVQGIQREKSDKAFAEQVMKKYMGLTEQAIIDFTYDFYANEVAVPVPLPKVEQFQATQQALGTTNAKIKSFDLTTLVDQSFVKKAAAELGIKESS